VYPHGGAGGVDEDSDEEEAAAPVPAPAAAAAPAPAAGRRNCPLCLGRLKTPTLTTCGHVFCWHCVASWCAQAKDQCPLCRHPVQMHRDLVALSNY
jgi:peroxin-10